MAFTAVLQSEWTKIRTVAFDAPETPYGPWGGFGIMALWTLAAVLGGYAVLRKRDA